MKILSTFVAFALAAAACTTPTQEPEPEQILLRVNDSTVTLNEYRKVIKRATNSLSDIGVMDKQAFENLKRRTVQELIEKTLLLEIAKERGISISDEELELELQALHEGTDQQRRTRLVRNAYHSDSTWRQTVREQMLLDRVIQAQFPAPISFSEEDARQYYEEHKDQFRIPKGVHLFQIVLADKKEAQEIYEQVRRKPNVFEELAREHSIALEASQGGDMGVFEQSDLPATFAPAFRLREGGISAPVKTPYGYHIFHVRSRTWGNRFKPFSDVRSEIEVALARAAQSTAFDTGIREKIQASNIEIDRDLLSQVVQ